MRSSLFLVLLLFLISPADLLGRKNSTELYQRGAALAKGGDISGAVKTFKEVVALSPHYSLGHYGLGKAYLYSEGNLDNAVLHLKKSVLLDRSSGPAHFYLAMAYLLKGEKIAALHAFQAAYEKDDSLIEALFNIGAIYDSMDQEFKAGKFFQRYLYEIQRDEDDIF